MIIKEQLNEFLAQYGVTLPSFVVDAIIEKLDTITPCIVGAGYSDATATLIYAYAGAILAGNTGTRRVKSQGAPSGASQSFDYGSMDFTVLRRNLAQLDTSGCTTELIGADPVSGNFFAVVG
ncbi:DUF7370 family protein [Plesiomonas sp.]|uniref:DUF7370 family protein n=1 Tax=Plesiomonas sp. TaxID=2486279 RepID=UPI003F3C03C2